jgi:hypothetical protein
MPFFVLNHIIGFSTIAMRRPVTLAGRKMPQIGIAGLWTTKEM